MSNRLTYIISTTIIAFVTLLSLASVARADFPVHTIESGDDVDGPQIDGVVDSGPMGGDLDPAARTFVELYDTPDEALEALLVLISSIEATLDRLEGQVKQGLQTSLKRLVYEAVLTTRGLTRVGNKIDQARTQQLLASSLQNLSERIRAQLETNLIINEIALRLQGAQAISGALAAVAGILDEPLAFETQAQLEESLILLIVLERVLVESLGETITP